jgi:hypothetical protein
LAEDWRYLGLLQDLSLNIYKPNEKNEYSTVKDLFNFVKSELNYTAGITTLRKILKSMGYTYKIINNRKILVESLRLKSMKITFLRKYLRYNEAGAIFIFPDETRLFQNGTPVRRWINKNDPKSFPKFVSNTEGARFISPEYCGQALSSPLYIRKVPGSNPGVGFFSELSPHHHIVVCLISQIRRMLGQYQPLRTYHLPSAPILTVSIPNLSVSVAEKALGNLSSPPPPFGGE